MGINNTNGKIYDIIQPIQINGTSAADITLVSYEYE